MSLDADLLSRFLDQLTKMIKSRQEMTGWFEWFIDDIRKQEIAVNSTKTAAGALGVVSAIGLFTPFAPLALAGMVAAGGAGVATTIGDLIANKVKGGNLETKVESMKTEESELENLQQKLNKQAERLSQELGISKEDAVVFALVGIPKIVAQAGVQVVRGGVEIVRVLPHLRAIKDAMSMGASFSQAARLGTTVFQGASGVGRLSQGAAVAGTTLVVSTAAKALGGFGAVIGVADAVYSWSTKNPNRASAEELLPKLRKTLASLKNTKKQFEELQQL